MQHKNLHKLHDIRHLTETAFVLMLERNGFEFIPGQHILLGAAHSHEQREYSIYSSIHDEFLEVLVREVEGGQVSRQLKKLKAGDMLSIEGPVGFFTLNQQLIDRRSKFVFVASGTGIAPFHSMIKSIPHLDYTLIHGVRYADESYGKADYDPERYIICSTGDQQGDFQGRLTQYLKTHPVPEGSYCYFCGNFNMIKDAMPIVERQGIPQNHFHTEVYF